MCVNENGKVVSRMVENRRMKCSDIPDDLFLEAVNRTPSVDGSFEPRFWRMRWDVQTTLESSLGEVPEKLFIAKARKLMKAKKLGGCPCGCRGDYHIPCGDENCYETCGG